MRPAKSSRASSPSTRQGRGRRCREAAWFIDQIEDTRGLALPGKPTDLDRAKQQYLLVDYSTPSSLDGYVQKNKADPRLAEAYYYRARSHEELGELGKAIDDYARPQNFDNRNWARDAERRLFLLGSVYGQGENSRRMPWGSSRSSPTNPSLNRSGRMRDHRPHLGRGVAPEVLRSHADIAAPGE